MTRADKALVLLLRFVGVPALFALVAVVIAGWIHFVLNSTYSIKVPSGCRTVIFFPVGTF